MSTASAEMLYLAVGLALTDWEETEDRVENLFDALCGMAEPIAAEWLQGIPGHAECRI